MAGIRVPDTQYEAPTLTPQMAEVPMPKQPVANANDFGAAQAEAGEKAGAEVKASTISVAEDIIQQKAWSQTSQAFQNREVLNEAASKLMNDTDTHTVTNPDGTTREVPNGYGLRTGADKVDPAFLKSQLQELQNNLVPQGGWLNSVAKVNARYTDEVISSAYNKLDAYNKDQYKRDTASGFQNAYSKSLLNSIDQPNMTSAIHYTQAPLFNMLANGQVEPKDHLPAQEKNALDTMNKFTEANIGKLTDAQLKQQVDDAQKASGGIITGDVKAQAYDSIDKHWDAYQKQVKINQEHDQADSVQEFTSGVGSGKYNASNATAILADKNLPSNVGQALYNAVMNVNAQKISGINKGGTMNDTVPINKQTLDIHAPSAEKEEAKQASDYTLAIANSLNTKDASDKLVTAITSDKLDKIQLEVYTRTLALVGQYAPTETEQSQDGKTIDPKGVAAVSGLRDIATWGKSVGVNDVSHLKQYLDNNNTNMNPTYNLADVKQNVMNNRFPNTVASGKTPNIVVDRGGSQRYFIQRDTDASKYPFIYDEASKMVIPNKDYKQARPQASEGK